jgi:competence protein ComEA
VTGAVLSPQTLVAVPYGSRVLDAVEAAGGFAESADRDRVNLAQVLRNGDQIHVYELPAPETPQAAEIALPTPNDSGIVHEIRRRWKKDPP